MSIDLRRFFKYFLIISILSVWHGKGGIQHLPYLSMLKALVIAGRECILWTKEKSTICMEEKTCQRYLSRAGAGVRYGCDGGLRRRLAICGGGGCRKERKKVILLEKQFMRRTGHRGHSYDISANMRRQGVRSLRTGGCCASQSSTAAKGISLRVVDELPMTPPTMRRKRG